MLGWELPPYNSGGLGVACYELCKSLAARGADIEFVVPYQADHGIDFMQVTAASPQGVVAVLQEGSVYDSARYVFEDGHEDRVNIYTQQQRYEEAVAELVERRGETFDLIHAHDWLTFRAALRAKQFACCPLVVQLHSVERDRAGGDAGNPLAREIESMTMLMADRVIAVSQYTKDQIIKDYGIPAEKIEVVHNSINPGDFAPLSLANAYTYLAAMKRQGYRVVSNVGRLTIQKGLTNLLYAAKEVIAHAPKTLFLIVGSGEQYYELLQLAADLGIARNVIFTEFQRGQRWRDAFTIADLFVMPSVSEPFGLTALEAIGYGTPVLASKQSGVIELVRNCLQVDFWDIHEMANQITAVMQNDALRDNLHENAYRELQHLSWDDSARKMIDLYERHGRKKAAA